MREGVPAVEHVASTGPELHALRLFVSKSIGHFGDGAVPVARGVRMIIINTELLIADRTVQSPIILAWY